MRWEDPVAPRHAKIGLLGGSFDPAHAGHAHITRTALKRFNLDQVWWLVSPGNPLKTRGPAPIAQRVAAGQRLMDHPKVRVTDIELRLGTRATAQTLAGLQERYVGARFVWLMGADNLTQFDQWQDWRSIIESVPIGVLARPGDRMPARLSRAARIYRAAQIPGRASSILAEQTAPAWCFVNLPMTDLSSTVIRAERAIGEQDLGKRDENSAIMD